MDKVLEIRPGRRIHIKHFETPLSQGTIFLIHGLGGNANQWRSQISFLKDNYNLIIPDLFGHGESDKPCPLQQNPYSFTELDLDMHALFTQFAGEKNIIIGHSYGGALATSLALDHQDTVNKVVLIAPIACLPTLKIPAVYHLPTFFLEWIRPLLEKQFDQLAFDVHSNPELRAEERVAAKMNPLFVIKSMINGASNIPALDITMLTIQTLIILGKDDRLVPNPISRTFYQKLPHHHFRELQEASHMVMLEKPQTVNETIINFLN